MNGVGVGGGGWTLEPARVLQGEVAGAAEDRIVWIV